MGTSQENNKYDVIVDDHSLEISKSKKFLLHSKFYLNANQFTSLAAIVDQLKTKKHTCFRPAKARSHVSCSLHTICGCNY